MSETIHICDDKCKHTKRPFLNHHTHDKISSTRDSSADIESMFKLCAQNKMGFSSTNHGWGASFVSIHENSKKYGVKPVYGIEFYLNRYRDRLFFIRKELERLGNLKTSSMSKDEKENVDAEVRALNYEFDDIKKSNHICILAKNELGFRNILELHNIASLNGFYSKPLITLDEIFSADKDKNGDRGLIVTSACLAGVIPRDILSNNIDKAVDHALLMKEEFRDDFYLEIQPHELEEQRTVNLAIKDISKKTKIPFCIGTDSHYLSKDYSRSHQIFLLLQGEEKVKDIGRKVWSITYETLKGETRRKKIEIGENFHGHSPEDLKPGDKVSKQVSKNADKYDFVIKNVDKVNKVWMIEGADLSFKTEEQLRQHAKTFDDIADVVDEAIEVNKDIYEKIEEWQWDNDLKLPVFEDGNERLFNECIKGLKDKGLDKDKQYVDRFKKEFTVIKKSGLAAYFIILLEMFEYARSIHLPSGPARGSAGASLILYLLGITRIDPLKWDFPFERFLNERKISENSERVRIETENGTIDLNPNDEVKLGDGTIKKAKDLKLGDDFEI